MTLHLRAAVFVAFTLAASAIALDAVSMARRPPAPSRRSRANDTPALDHVAGGGPDGGSVWSLAVSAGGSSHAFAAMWGGGVYVSHDRGRTWTPADRGLPAMAPCDLAADPVDGATIYAACGDGLFKTTDGGARWRQLDIDFPDAPLIAPSNPQVLYQPPAGNGLLRSRDGGRRWRFSASARQMGRCGSDILIDSSNAMVLYCNSDRGVLVSRTGGTRWRELPGSPPDVSAMAIGPGRTTSLVVATRERGLFRFDGAAWEPLGTPDGPAITTLQVVDADGLVLYAQQDDRLARSTNGGTDWEALPAAWPRFLLSTFAVARDAPDVVLAGGSAGIFVSEDGGRHWARRMAGIARATPWLAWHEADPPALVAQVGTSLLASSDDGATWSPFAPDERTTDVDAGSLASDGAGGVMVNTRAGALRLARGETTWTPDTPAVRVGVNHGGNDAVTSIRVRPAADGFLLSDDGGGTWRTVRGPWSTARHGTPHALAPTAVVRTGSGGRTLVASVGGLLATGSPAQNTLWRSTDDGATWTRTHDLKVGIVAHCCGLAVDPATSDTLFAVVSGMVVGGGGAQVLRSLDAGRTWAELPDGWFSGMFGVVPTTPTSLFGQTYERGLVRSTDAGDHWTPSGVGLPPGVDVIRIVAALRRPHVLFAATDSRGIYRSVDAGASWHPTGRAISGQQ